MKRIITLAAFLVMLTTASAREYKVHGPQGGLAVDITLPKGFDPETEKCHMVILMHGIFSSGNIVPIPSLARELAEVGIASIRFDFGGHWRSEGEMQHMTIGKEIEDALAMWEYAQSLPYVSDIGRRSSVHDRRNIVPQRGKTCRSRAHSTGIGGAGRLQEREILQCGVQSCRPA